MADTCEYYVKLFSKLRADSARWKGVKITQEQAPHKPRWLLAFIVLVTLCHQLGLVPPASNDIG